jgi:dTDP-4-dehydrorhamnose reductase
MISGKKVLILGASGLLGSHLCEHYKNENKVLGTRFKNLITINGVEVRALDQLDKSALNQLLLEFQPDIVFNTTSLANTDLCETCPELAERLNVDTIINLIETIAPESLLVHISTDHLSDGLKPLVSEEVAPSPKNVYAKTKWKAEKYAAQHSNHLIIRTNFFGESGPFKKTFSSWIIESLRDGRELKLFDDSYFSPIFIDDLIFYIDKLIAKQARGIFNIVTKSRLSKYNFGVKLAKELSLPESLILESKLADADLPAARPLDMSLSSSKLEREVQEEVINLDQSIRRYLDRLRS